VSPNTVHRWVKGNMAVPQYAAAYVSLLQLSATRNPGE
jgi:hypothetical protein